MNVNATEPLVINVKWRDIIKSAIILKWRKVLRRPEQRATCCPIALATKRETGCLTHVGGYVRVYCNPTHGLTGRLVYTIPDTASRFIGNFDKFGLRAVGPKQFIFFPQPEDKW